MAPSEESPERSANNVGRRWYSLARWRRIWPFALGLLGSLIGLLVYTTLESAPTQSITQGDIEDAVTRAVESARDPSIVPVEVYQAILPSIVYIRTEGVAGERGSGLGSGVIINQDGSILTAYHVVEGASRIKVVFYDGTEAVADIVSAEPENDLAVLIADGAPEVIVPAVLGGGIRVGDETFAVGNPLGLVASLSAGVISGLDRSIPLRGSDEVMSGLIQFDAAVNPGSSGGPLLNRAGQVVGIVTALANPTDQDSFTGIGFAVPIGAAGGGAGGPPR